VSASSGPRVLLGHGTENDFVVLPDPEGTVWPESRLDAELVRRLCDRRAGLGGDGVLRVVPSRCVPDAAAVLGEALPQCTWFMDHRNADGSTAEMCGNGIRLFLHVLLTEGLLDRAAAEAGVLLQVGYWRRFVPSLVALGEQLSAGAFGVPLLVSCWQWDAQPPPPSFRERSGGILLDMGVHELDQIRWLTRSELGEIVAFADGIDADVATALVRVEDGTEAVISLGRTFPHGDCCWIELMGRRAYVRELFMWGDDGRRVFEDALVAQAEAFAAAIRGEPQRGASGEDAIRAIEAAERAARSLAPAAV
jgi:hypothetical protein